MNNSTYTNVIIGRAVEKWKNLKLPKKYKLKHKCQISNYGRIRLKIYEGEEFYLKNPIIYNQKVVYKFKFSPQNKDEKQMILHQEAKKLVARHFCKDYYDGCYVLWQDYNRLNNFYGNLLCLDPSAGRSHAAKGRYKKVEQIPVIPPAPKKEKTKDSSPHRVEDQNDYFKTIPGYSGYEINREGVVRKARAPHKGRIISQRLHPDKFYFMDLRDDLQKRKTMYTHKAVAMAWNINVMPEKRKIVIHKDGDTLNNHSDNLEWVDHSEALKHQFATKQRDNKKSWKTRKKLYGKSGRKNKKSKKTA